MSAALRYLVECPVDPATEAAQTVRLEDIESGSARLVAQPPVLPPDGQNKFESGDVLFSKLRPYLAKSLLVTQPMNGTGELLCLRPSEKVDARFLRYVTLSQPWLSHAVQTSYGMKMPRSSWDAMGSFLMPDQPPDEQRRIADFLDDRVSRIDRIIAARREQVRLLDSHCMAWLQEEINDLGRVHGWTTLRRLGLKVEQGWSPLADSVPASSGEPGVLKLGAVRGGTFDPGENKAFLAGAVPKGEYLLKKGDLLITRANTPNLVGDAAVVDHLSTSPLYLSDLIYRIHVEHMDHGMVSAALRTSMNRQEVGILARGTSGSMPKLRGSDLAGMVVPWVPRLQQTAQSKSEIEQRANRDRQQSELLNSIELLTEYKSSLITAAVTGELDVTTAGSNIPG